MNLISGSSMAKKTWSCLISRSLQQKCLTWVRKVILYIQCEIFNAGCGVKCSVFVHTVWVVQVPSCTLMYWIIRTCESWWWITASPGWCITARCSVLWEKPTSNCPEPSTSQVLYVLSSLLSSFLFSSLLFPSLLSSLFFSSLILSSLHLLRAA